MNAARDLAMEGLLREVARAEPGCDAGFVARVMGALPARPVAATPVWWSGAVGETLRLAQRAHDGRLDAAGMQAWAAMCADDPDIAAIDNDVGRLAHPLLPLSRVPVDQAVAEIMERLPQTAPRRPLTVSLGAVAAALTIVTVLAGAALGSRSRLDVTDLTLLLANVVLICVAAIIAFLLVRRRFGGEMGNLTGRLLALVDLRVRPAPAAALLVIGVLVPGLLIASNLGVQ